MGPPRDREGKDYGQYFLVYFVKEKKDGYDVMDRDRKEERKSFGMMHMIYLFQEIPRTPGPWGKLCG